MGFLSFILESLEVFWYLTNYSVNIVLDIEPVLTVFLVAQITCLNWYAIFTLTQIWLSICYLIGGKSRRKKGYWNRKPLLEAHKEKYMFQDLR